MPISTRFVAALLACGALALSLPALADSKKDKKDKDAAAKPALVATYGDWSVYRSDSGKGRICYTLATPKTRDPDDAKREPSYAFISERPVEQVRNEVSFVMGYDVAAPEAAKVDEKGAHDKGGKAKVDPKDKKTLSPSVEPTATVGETDFELLPKGADLWVKNPAKESQLIEEMRRGKELKIRASSKKGAVTVDTYSLTGFKQAIDRAVKDCPPS
jgi:hypothetical protein